MHQDMSTKLTMTATIILLKLVIPTVILVKPIDLTVVLYTIVFGGFYMHFVEICCIMNLNDDLKTRNQILLVIKKLIDIQSYMQSHQSTILIDISCALSLQSWDTMRHITLLIDKARANKYTFLFGFLVLYAKICLGAYIICFFKISFIEAYGYCDESIVIYNMHIDVVHRI